MGFVARVGQQLALELAKIPLGARIIVQWYCPSAVGKMQASSASQIAMPAKMWLMNVLHTPDVSMWRSP